MQAHFECIHVYSVSRNKISQRENRDIYIMHNIFIQNFSYLFSTYFFTSLFNFNNVKSLTLHNWALSPNDNVSMPGHLDRVLLTVYSSMQHVTWKSPGPMCGWVGRMLRFDSCISRSSWSKVPLLSIWFVAMWFSVYHFCLVSVNDTVLFQSMVCDSWLVSYTALPWSGGSGLCTNCERVHFFSGHMLQGYWRDVLCRVKPLGQGSSTSWARAPSPSVEDTLVPALSAGQSPLQHTMHLPPIGGALSVGLHVIFGTVEIVFGRPIATFYNDNFRTS